MSKEYRNPVTAAVALQLAIGDLVGVSLQSNSLGGGHGNPGVLRQFLTRISLRTLHGSHRNQCGCQQASEKSAYRHNLILKNAPQVR